ncbi:RNase adapter RapZ [Oceanobacter mangrovi]|uniref:RNase adapter RapZ n=1 Tax=Oceanobacter mangrovi TaxID=2862510 RepID=UPI001C8D1ABA|nr:RNase adapter RapZ [Oceanobacter mangrovi]
MRLVVISGRSGSGKSSALAVLEDLGFYCIDNLPVDLLPALADLPSTEKRKSIAVSVDVRNLPDAIEHITEVLTELPKQYRQLDIVFLDATEEVLLQRFSSTRRKHPLTNNNISLAEAIERETEMLGPVANMADLTLDTTRMSVHELRSLIKMRVAEKNTPDMAVLFQSFGFKQGIPLDADFVFDVRCLPNPYWQPELRPFTGQDPEIRQFLANKDEVNQMFADIEGYLLRWLPSFEQNNRSYLTIAIGCTGGQHRSVYLSERLAGAFADKFSNVQVRHRELNRQPHSHG